MTNIHISVPKGYRLTVRTRKDGTFEIVVEPIGPSGDLYSNQTTPVPRSQSGTGSLRRVTGRLAWGRLIIGRSFHGIAVRLRHSPSPLSLMAQSHIGCHHRQKQNKHNENY